MPNKQIMSPHVFIFPLPLQGPVNCMLKLAELLCLQEIKVTFLNTQHIQSRLRRSTNTEDYFKKYPNFRFETIPDGLPEENPRTGDQIPNLMQSMEDVSLPIFREMVVGSGVKNINTDKPVTCLIADGLFTFATDVAEEVGVPLLYFDTISPCGLWAYLCLPRLIEAGEVPFKDENLDELVTNAPGCEGFMRRRDLPSFCRSKDVNNDSIVKLVLKEDERLPLAEGLIFNTFQELEAPILSRMRSICPNVYAVGPLHTHLKARLGRGGASAEPISTSSSIWEEDKSCISWLDSQPLRSVVYVSIGSLAVMSKDQLLEIWHGLVKSGSRFLWVQRPNSILGHTNHEMIPRELSQGTKERGLIVSWAPQQQVLAHPSIGGFLTHSGWNSTMESIVEGKPMICWPQFVDQQVNSRYVSEVWGLGLDMKDTCDRAVVEKMVRDVMQLRKGEFLESADKMAKLAAESVSEGGSSYRDFDRLLEDIKLMKLNK